MSVARPFRVLAASAALAGATAVSAAAQAGIPPTGFEEGEPFPTLAFATLDGDRERSLADFRGHKLILHVFASW